MNTSKPPIGRLGAPSQNMSNLLTEFHSLRASGTEKVCSRDFGDELQHSSQQNRSLRNRVLRSRDSRLHRAANRINNRKLRRTGYRSWKTAILANSCTNLPQAPPHDSHKIPAHAHRDRQDKGHLHI